MRQDTGEGGRLSSLPGEELDLDAGGGRGIHTGNQTSVIWGSGEAVLPTGFHGRA